MKLQSQKVAARRKKSMRTLPFDHREMDQASAFDVNDLPHDILFQIVKNLNYQVISRLKTVNIAFRKFVDGEPFRAAMIASGRCLDTISQMLFFLRDGALEWMGYNSTLQRWIGIPSLRALLPSPPLSTYHTPTDHPSYLVVSAVGLVCMDISDRYHPVERIIMCICNPLTQSVKELPTLHFRRRPVLLHLQIDNVTKNYKVTVIGHAMAVNDDPQSQSKKTEICDSESSKLEVLHDMLGPDYSVNLYQNGALLHGRLHCLAFNSTLCKSCGQHEHIYQVVDVNSGAWVTEELPLADEYYQSRHRCQIKSLSTAISHAHLPGLHTKSDPTSLCREDSKPLPVRNTWT